VFRGESGEARLSARTVLIAAGTSPNTVLQEEFPEALSLHGRYFRLIDETGAPALPEHRAKPAAPQALTALESDGRAISFYGDLHPSYAGNVVKAMGSAKQNYPAVTRLLLQKPPADASPASAFLARILHLCRARVKEVNRLTPTIVELVVEAPLAARAFRPGQFYRLQNFAASNAPLMEGLAMTGAWIDPKPGLVAVIALEMGGSSNLIRHLKPGEPVVLMGPTGTPTEIPAGKKMLLAGGGLGNAVLFSIGQALKAAGSQVLYFAGYRQAQDRYKAGMLEESADQVVWCCDEARLTPNRPQDFTFQGNIIDAMRAYGAGALGAGAIALQEIDHLIVIGSDRMMAALALARHSVLKPYLNPRHTAIGSINSPMQCMMKEICGQCLQLQIDPETGVRRYVYSCMNQDQELDKVSFPFLHERLKQNSLQEKLTRQWLAAS
jgi:NAD(P)H-flavin reductase